MSSPNSVGIDPDNANEDVFKAVADSYYHTRRNEQTGRTGQLVQVEFKGRHVDELAEFGGDRPCQRK